MSTHTFSEDDRLEVLARWLRLRKHPTASPIPITTLVKQLRQLRPDKQRPFPKNAASLGSWLGRYKAVIKAELGVRVIPTRSALVRFWSFKEGGCHVVGSPPCETETVPVHDVMAAANSQDFWLDAID